MHFREISFEAILDETTIAQQVRTVLESRFPEASSIDIPFVGEVQVDIIRVDLKELRFIEGRLLNKLSLDLKVSPQWPNLKISVIGKLDVDIEIAFSLSQSQFIQTSIDITKFDWQHGPSLKIWNHDFNLWLIKVISEWQKSNIADAVDKLIKGLLAPLTLSKQIAQQLRPLRISDQLFAQFNDLNLDLQTLQIDTGRLSLSGEIDTSIELLKDFQRLGQCQVHLKHHPPEFDNDIVDVVVSMAEVNEVIEVFIDDLNEDVLHGKNLISSIHVVVEGESLKVTMVPTKMKHSSLIMTMALTFEEDQQKLILHDDFKVRASKDAGLMVKALTYTLRGTVEKMVKKKFPLNLSPLLEYIATKVDGEGPHNLHIRINPLSIKTMHYGSDSITGTFQMRIRMSTDPD